MSENIPEIKRVDYYSGTTSQSSWKEQINSMISLNECKICKCQLVNISEATGHYDSKTHNLNVQAWLQTYSNEEFYCDVCDANFLNAADHETHKKNFHSEMSGLIFCEICKINFSSRYRLLRHKEGFFHKKKQDSVTSSQCILPKTGKDHSLGENETALKTKIIASDTEKYSTGEKPINVTVTSPILKWTSKANLGQPHVQFNDRTGPNLFSTQETPEILINIDPKKNDELCGAKEDFYQNITHCNLNENSTGRYSENGREKNLILLREIKEEIEKIINTIYLSKKIQPQKALNHLRHFNQSFENTKNLMAK